MLDESYVVEIYRFKYKKDRIDWWEWRGNCYGDVIDGSIFFLKENKSLGLEDNGVVNDFVNSSVDWDMGRWDRERWERWKFRDEEVNVSVNDEVFVEGVIVVSEEIMLKKSFKKDRKSESVGYKR